MIRVEAFAVAKGSGILFTGPLVSFFIPRHWDLLVGILPTYWYCLFRRRATAG